MAKSYKVTVIAGTKIVADMAKNVLDATISASLQVKTVAGGTTSANPTILAPGPAGQNRKMEDVVGWFVNGTGNPLVAVGEPWEAPTGFKNTNWWDGTAGTWSLGSSVALPMQQGVPVLNPTGNGLPTEKATADYVSLQVNTSKQDIIDSILNNSLNIETYPELTPKRYINVAGTIQETTSDRWNATLNYEPLRGATILGYKGYLGTASTKIAFYSSPDNNGFITSFPKAEVAITEQDFNVPEGAKFYRVSCQDPITRGFKITLKNVPLFKDQKVVLTSFEFTGNSFVYVNDVIQQANIIWNDGSTGRVTYGDWDENNMAYRSFTATSIENNLLVTQPPVIFNAEGQITSYPSFIITPLI